MPISSPLTAESLLEWTKTLKGLAPEQLERIRSLAPQLLPEELSELKKDLEQNSIKHEEEEELLKQAAARQQEFLSDDKREQLQSTEAAQQIKDAQTADALFTNL